MARSPRPRTRDWDAGRRSCRALSVACGAQVDYYEFLRRLVVLRSSWRGVTDDPAEPRAVAEAREPAPRGGGGGPGSGPGGGGGGPGGGRGGYSLSAEMSKLEAALVAAAVARGGGGMLPVGEVKRLAALYRVSAPVRCSNESARSCRRHARPADARYRTRWTRQKRTSRRRSRASPRVRPRRARGYDATRPRPTARR